VLLPADEKQRVKCFEELLTDLRLAASDGFSALKNQCDSTQTAINATYPVLPMFKDTSMLHVVDQDSYSKTMIPPDVPEKLIPLKCYGDGNCLFRYIIIIIIPHVMYVQFREST
jgi:hypothetical protein